jgi:predicted lipid-binding transport protein (Tim44 family)
MKRSIAITSALVLALSSLLFVAEASARAGGGSSGGSRGSRSYSAPAPKSPSQVSPSRPTAPASPMAPAMPQRSGWGGMLGGLLVGGLIGSLLFGGMGGGLGGLGGGIGLMEIVLIGGLIVFAIMWMRRRQAAGAMGTPAYAGGYGGPSSGGWQPSGGSTYSGGGSSAAPVAVLEAPAELSDLDRGLGHIRQMDAQFDPAAFSESATDMFFKIQAAWTNRDMGRVTDLVTPEMRGVLQAQCDKLRADRRINRLENIAVRQAAVTEGWQEKGQDFVTVYFLASLVDYTTDESGAQVLDGSRTEPVKFEEYWTFARPVGPNPWKLSAIQQAA